MVGIDGSGKSALIAKLKKEDPFSSVRAISCPDIHSVTDGPLHSLSLQMAAFSAAADRAANPEVKAAALYLRMTLFGPVEKFIVDTYQPRLLICERHPMVETLVYTPIYQHLESGARNAKLSGLAEIFDETDLTESGAANAIEQWWAMEACRTGFDESIVNILSEIVKVVSQPLKQSVSILQLCYRTTLPSDIVWLDIEPEIAAARTKSRGKRVELHETEPALTQLRSNYRKALTALQIRGVKIHRIVVTENMRIGTLASIFADVIQPTLVSGNQI
ncbi:hypothetical protein HQO90_12900 [Rhodococcus fascians]|nr:hypothetical protein [Rhodococcus fascians]